jgi:hypothetical protein
MQLGIVLALQCEYRRISKEEALLTVNLPSGKITVLSGCAQNDCVLRTCLE